MYIANYFFNKLNKNKKQRKLLMNVSLDNISCFKCEKIPDPKNLICCLCYCLISKDGKQCKNNKCLKIYCADCNLKLVFHNNLCSYCRISKEYVGLDDIIINCLGNLLFFCPEFDCTNQYELEEYKSNHNHGDIKIDKDNKCNVCQFSLMYNPNSLVCNICNSKYCFKNLEYVPFKINKKYIKKFENQTPCMKRCINCLAPVCNLCNTKYIKYKLNNFICEYCEIKCQICSNNNSMTFCDYCHKPICENCFKKDTKNNLILCTNDYDKDYINDSIPKYYISEKYEKCPICKEKIEDINSLVKCKETNCKNKYICYKCSLFCNICKKIICKQCSLYCSQCKPELSLVSCKSCNSNTIKKCSKENCNNMLCINCYNSCNYCSIILCDKHKYQCLNCQDSMCENHFSLCKICDKNEDYKKACLKKCTHKCNFCENMNNELCNKDNHKNTFVQKYNCEHNVCLECVKRCEKCKKIVKTCSRCTVNYYFEHCNFCNKYLCFDCGKQCKNCEDYYCDYSHQCNLCKQTIEEGTCLKCIYNSRVKCGVCKKGLKQCDKCKNTLVCSKKCYFDNKGNPAEHLCQMFYCDLCVKRNSNNYIDIIRQESREKVSEERNMKSNNNISGYIRNNEQINILNIQNQPRKNSHINNNNNDKYNIQINNDKKKVCCCENCSIY